MVKQFETHPSQQRGSRTFQYLLQVAVVMPLTPAQPVSCGRTKANTGDDHQIGTLRRQKWTTSWIGFSDFKAPLNGIGQVSHLSKLHRVVRQHPGKAPFSGVAKKSGQIGFRWQRQEGKNRLRRSKRFKFLQFMTYPLRRPTLLSVRQCFDTGKARSSKLALLLSKVPFALCHRGY